MNITFLAKAIGPGSIGGDPNAAPIDGGLSLLIAGGLGYSVKKIKKQKKKGENK